MISASRWATMRYKYNLPFDIGYGHVKWIERHYLRAQRQGHHTIDRLEEEWGVVQTGSARSTIFLGRSKKAHTFNQTNIGNCFKGNTGETPGRRGGAHTGFPEGIDNILNLNWTELIESRIHSALIRSRTSSTWNKSVHIFVYSQRKEERTNPVY